MDMGASIDSIRDAFKNGKISVDIFDKIIEYLDETDDEYDILGILLFYRDKAEPLLKSIIDASNDPLALLLLVEILYAEERYNEAEEITKNAISKVIGENKQVSDIYHYILAKLYWRLNRLEEAYNECLKALEIKRDNEVLHLLAVDILVDMNRWSKAKKHIKHAIQILPYSHPLRKELKSVLRGEEEYRTLDNRITVGSICRLTLANMDMISEATAKIKKFRRDIIKSRYDEYLERGDYIDAIKELYKDRDNIDKDEWIDKGIYILERYKPGFELNLAYNFFKDRCSRCTHREGKLSMKGLYQCPFDPMYNEYLYAVIEDIISKIANGYEGNIEEFNVDDKIREFSIKLEHKEY